MARLPLSHRIHNSPRRKRHRGQAMRCSFNGHHAKTFRVSRQLAHRKDVQGRTFISACLLLRVGNHTQKAQMLANARSIGHRLDAVAGLHIGMQGICRCLPHNHQQRIGCGLDDGR